MQPDYNKLWYNLNTDSQAIDAHFYAFYEDSLNQFISTNSKTNQTAAKENSNQLLENLNSEKQNLISLE